jgi:hypothetical protein
MGYARAKEGVADGIQILQDMSISEDFRRTSWIYAHPVGALRPLELVDCLGATHVTDFDNMITSGCLSTSASPSFCAEYDSL